VSLVDTLAVLPTDHPLRAGLLARLRNLASGLERYQDRATWRWRQVMDKGPRPLAPGSDAPNFLETSCSAMHAYTLSRAVNWGWINPRFRAIADSAFRGVLNTVSPVASGTTARIEGTVQGTDVGGLAYYLGRQQKDNDLHGIGAFLIMHEHMARLPAATAPR
jgi:unsaturated rhamnogalacturonyl hydrolase